jgi:hypothetical protein
MTSKSTLTGLWVLNPKCCDITEPKSKTFDVEIISLAIGAVAGQQGPLECVVLNACWTENPKCCDTMITDITEPKVL